MIMLSIEQLNKIKEIADNLDIQQFSIDSNSNGIGNTLQLSYQTMLKDDTGTFAYPATVTVDLTDWDNW